MHSTKLKMFGKLYGKEMHDLIPEIMIVAIGVLLVTAWFFLQRPDPAPVVIGPLMLLLGLAGFLPLVTSFKLLSKEWTNNTVYLIMSLPVSGTMVMGTKMLALLSQYIVGTLLVGLSGWLVYTNGIYQFFAGRAVAVNLLQKPELIQHLVAFYLATVVFLLFLCCTSFFSQVVGKLSRKFSGLITTVVFLVTLIMSGKIMNWLDIAGNPVAMSIMNGNNSKSILYSLNAYSLSHLLLAILIFILVVVLYDKKLEL